MKAIATQVHIFGAGLAGLAAAVRCLEKGLAVTVYEAANHAGGRCRSFHDSAVDRMIDNGNHLILGGNNGIFEYLRTIGADTKLRLAENAFPFIDLLNDESWTLRPGSASFPLWILFPHRRIPGTSVKDYTTLKKIINVPSDLAVKNYVDPESVMFKRFWEPLCTSVLNTDAKEGSARLIGRMLELTFLRGPAFVRPFLTPEGLSATLVDPAVDYVIQRGGHVRFSERLRSVNVSEARVDKVTVGNEEIKLGKTDHIVLALPPNEVAALIPELIVPTETRPIINVHFRLNTHTPLPNDAPFIGVVNGTSQWVFRRGDIFSVTVSNAVALVDHSAEELAMKIWLEVVRIIKQKEKPLPPYRVLKERRATIAQTPTQDALRPDSATKWENLHLAGDWTNTGLPATIEGAVQSGQIAAETIQNR